VTPYDDFLGSFAKALLLEGLKKDRKIGDTITEATDRFRARLDSLGQDERIGYRDVFWTELARSEEFLPRLGLLFEKARVKGRLRCSVCEEDKTFAPAGLQ